MIVFRIGQPSNYQATLQWSGYRKVTVRGLPSLVSSEAMNINFLETHGDWPEAGEPFKLTIYLDERRVKSPYSKIIIDGVWVGNPCG